jgi:molecular chaperone GrpE
MKMTEPREQESDSRPVEESATQEAAASAQEPGVSGPVDSGDQDPDVNDSDAGSDGEVGEGTAPEAETEPSPEEVLRAERDAFEEKWLRVVAELDNVRKRSRREVADTRRFAQAEILRSLLEFQDNFERALQSADDNSDTEGAVGFREGVELIYQKLTGVLKDWGVEPMEALGAEFDPNFHEAVAQTPSEDTEPGKVIEVVQQGFHFGDRVLRPARVIISS